MVPQNTTMFSSPRSMEEGGRGEAKLPDLLASSANFVIRIFVGKDFFFWQMAVLLYGFFPLPPCLPPLLLSNSRASPQSSWLQKSVGRSPADNLIVWSMSPPPPPPSGEETERGGSYRRGKCLSVLAPNSQFLPSPLFPPSCTEHPACTTELVVYSTVVVQWISLIRKAIGQSPKVLRTQEHSGYKDCLFL